VDGYLLISGFEKENEMKTGGNRNGNDYRLFVYCFVSFRSRLF